jgi:hypothetical protein
MAKAKLKTDKFTIKRKYRSCRSAVKRADSVWLRIGEVSIQKKNGEWVVMVGGEA